jgi:hypothetical protein
VNRPRRPRRDVIIRRFLAGDSIDALADDVAAGGDFTAGRDYVERAIRDALNRRRR